MFLQRKAEKASMAERGGAAQPSQDAISLSRRDATRQELLTPWSVPQPPYSDSYLQGPSEEEEARPDEMSNGYRGSRSCGLGLYRRRRLRRLTPLNPASVKFRRKEPQPQQTGSERFESRLKGNRDGQDLQNSLPDALRLHDDSDLYE